MKEFTIIVPKKSNLSNHQKCKQLSDTFGALQRFFEENSIEDDAKLLKTGIKNQELGISITVRSE